MESSYAIEDILYFEMQGKFGGAKFFTSKQNVSFLGSSTEDGAIIAQHGACGREKSSAAWQNNDASA